MLFNIFNGAMQTTAAPTDVTTGTAIKTMMQVKASATLVMRLRGWSISFNGAALAVPIKVELIETDVAATVTAAATADITRVDADALMCGDPVTNLIPVGTTSTGYTASAEGTITAVRNLEIPQFLEPIGNYVFRYELGCEPVVQVSKFARIRVTAPVAVNCYCGMTVLL